MAMDRGSFRIKKYEKINYIHEDTISDTNIDLDDLEICVDGKDLIFNVTWLRDSCHCSKCTHPHSRQRLFIPKDFKKDMFAIRDVEIVTKKKSNQSLDSSHSDMGYLRVRWADGHESEYALHWLTHVYGTHTKPLLNLKSSTRLYFHLPEDNYCLPARRSNTKPEHWNVSKLLSILVPVDYQDLVDGFNYNDDPSSINANRIADMSQMRFNAMKTLCHQLVTLGLAKIVNVPQTRNQVLNIARSLAYERPTGYGTVFDVTVEAKEEINLAYSSVELDLHSDLTYRETSPGVQLLHCIRNSNEGGLSHFSDSFKAAQTLRQRDPELFEVLVRYPMTFVGRDPYRDIKFQNQQPVISLDFQGNLSNVYYSPFVMPPLGHKDDVRLFYLALDKFTQLLHSQDNKFRTKMEPGDVYMFHNRRVLHGRSAYDAKNSSRFLQGCYMDWDEIKSLHDKLLAHKHEARD